MHQGIQPSPQPVISLGAQIHRSSRDLPANLRVKSPAPHKGLGCHQALRVAQLVQLIAPTIEQPPPHAAHALLQLTVPLPHHSLGGFPLAGSQLLHIFIIQGQALCFIHVQLRDGAVVPSTHTQSRESGQESNSAALLWLLLGRCQDSCSEAGQNLLSRKALPNGRWPAVKGSSSTVRNASIQAFVL